MDQALGTAAGRCGRAGELDAAVAAWTVTQPAGGWNGGCRTRFQRVSSSDRDCADPQLAHRGHLVRLPHPLHGCTTVEGPRYLLSDTPGRVTRAAPLLGQDNEYVLTKLLGYDADRVAALDAAGVLT
jgi:benzylsuccinate CoA-transferase BbsF subunit